MAVIDPTGERDPRVRLVRLSRNFGQHAAITAGLAHGLGRWTVVIDCDLEEKPEDIPRLYAAASRATTSSSHGAAAGTTHAFVGSRDALLQAPELLRRDRIDGEYGTFSIISRKVVDEYLGVQDKGRHYLFILSWLGFERDEIEVEQAQRPSGSSSYTLVALIRHAVDGLFFQTTILLRWIVYLGFALALAGLGLAAFLVVYGLSTSRSPAGRALPCSSS